jgi:hypothetical protein
MNRPRVADDFATFFGSRSGSIMKGLAKGSSRPLRHLPVLGPRAALSRHHLACVA